MTMDACGAYTRTLANHHSHDSEKQHLAPYEPGEGQGDISTYLQPGEMCSPSQ